MKPRYLWDDDEPEAEAKAGTLSGPPTPLSVTQLNQRIKNALEPMFSKVWLEGEISEITRPGSGHVYLVLKDEQSQIRAVLWRSVAERQKFQMKDGMKVLCQGKVEVYSPRGSYQFNIQSMEPKGIGALQLAFQQLHAKLSQEGLFLKERKKPIPKLPKRIGFVTSPTGAAVFDFLEVLRRRWNDVEIYIIPARVQGEGAVKDIVAGLQVAAKMRPRLDVVVVGRGGGSLDDLWTFNEEAVVRAVAACPLPTLSAVGHEIDVTLCDLAADLRALTPSEAAERVVPDSQVVAKQIASLRRQADQMMTNMLYQWERRLRELQSRPVLTRPIEGLLRREQRLDELQLRLDRALQNSLRAAKLQLQNLAASLEALNPLRVLARGYSMTCSHDGQVLTTIEQIELGQTIQTRLTRGSIVSRVESKHAIAEASDLPNPLGEESRELAG